MQLFIHSFGTSLRVKDGLLSVRLDDKIQQIPIGQIKTMFVTRGITLSTDVLYQFLENGVELLITERNGRPVGRLWNNRFGSISTIRKQQIDFCKSDRLTAWVCNQLIEKLTNQQELLYCLLTLDEPNTQEIESAAKAIEDCKEKLKQYRNDRMEDCAAQLRALEGQAARRYLKCINQHLPFTYQFDKRSKHPALDITNALFNYGYGILYGHVESALIKAGLDPFIGFFHRDEYNRPVLTYDVIEPFRPWADWVIIHLCLNEVIDSSFMEVEKGAFWLGREAKRILIQHFADFFEEVMVYKKHQFSRFWHMEQAARDLVKTINISKDSANSHKMPF